MVVWLCNYKSTPDDLHLTFADTQLEGAREFIKEHPVQDYEVVQVMPYGDLNDHSVYDVTREKIEDVK